MSQPGTPLDDATLDQPEAKASWLADPGVCPSCDRRRATGAAEARKQREKRRGRQKETVDG